MLHIGYNALRSSENVENTRVDEEDKINMTKQVIKPCKSEHNKEIEG